MTLPDDIAQWLQESLLNLNVCDFSIAWFASGNIESVPDYTAARWQLSVDMLYRTIACDLILVHNFIECSDEASFLHAVRAFSPFDVEGIVLWNGTLVYASPRLDKLVGAHFSPDLERRDKLNPAFIEALEQIFAQNGVPWSDKPLLPVPPSSAKTATTVQ
jgi:hypothetical protein